MATYVYPVYTTSTLPLYSASALLPQVTYNEISSEMGLARKTFRSVASRPAEVHVTRRSLDEKEEEEALEKRQRIGRQAPLLITHQAAGGE